MKPWPYNQSFRQFNRSYILVESFIIPIFIGIFFILPSIITHWPSFSIMVLPLFILIVPSVITIVPFVMVLVSVMGVLFPCIIVIILPSIIITELPIFFIDLCDILCIDVSAIFVCAIALQLNVIAVKAIRILFMFLVFVIGNYMCSLLSLDCLMLYEKPAIL
jgi:hypothetical protein